MPERNQRPLSTRAAAASRSRKRYPEKARARNAVRRAVASGALIRPGECGRCGVECTPEASHDDYENRLDVEWLCRPCHVKKDLPTHCVHGHEFTEENTWVHGGERYCRECRRTRKAEARRKAKDS